MTFKNTSDQVFQDGDLIVKPGESFSTEDESRIDQLTNQYAWQFDASKGDKAPTEAEAKESAPKGVRPSVGDSYVEVDAEGKQAKKIG
jgi:hypothetical protein